MYGEWFERLRYRVSALQRTEMNRYEFYSFMSYSTRDDEIKTIEPFVDDYVVLLRRLGVSYIPVFYDRFYIPQGHPDLRWYLKGQLHKSNFTTAFLSPGYVSSPWCAFEWWESENLSDLEPSESKPLKHGILPIYWRECADRAFWAFSTRSGINISKQLGHDPRDWEAALKIAVEGTIVFLESMYRDTSRSNPPMSEARSRNSLLRLFGSPRELLTKADADLNRLVGALSRGEQRAALWALMDCAIAVFHTGDWLRATHVDHRATSLRFAQRSQWIRIARDICHAAKHGDLTWDEGQAAKRGPAVAKLEYQPGPGRREQQQASFWVVTGDQSRHNVVDVLHHAISDWTRYFDQKGV